MPDPLGAAVPIYPTLLGCYVLGLTLISELESRCGRRIELLAGGLFIALAMIWALRGVLGAHWIDTLMREGRTMLAVLSLVGALMVAALMVWRIGRPWLGAVRSAQCRAVPPAVRAGLGGMLLFDALIAWAYHPLLAALILCLIPLQSCALRLIQGGPGRNPKS